MNLQGNAKNSGKKPFQLLKAAEEIFPMHIKKTAEISQNQPKESIFSKKSQKNEIINVQWKQPCISYKSDYISQRIRREFHFLAILRD